MCCLLYAICYLLYAVICYVCDILDMMRHMLYAVKIDATLHKKIITESMPNGTTIFKNEALHVSGGIWGNARFRTALWEYPQVRFLKVVGTT